MSTGEGRDWALVFDLLTRRLLVVEFKRAVHSKDSEEMKGEKRNGKKSSMGRAILVSQWQ